MSINPYSVTAEAPLQKGYFGEHSHRKEGAFLYRVVEIRHPIEAELVYSGWWFRQTIDIAGRRVWRRISWIGLKKLAEFKLPESIDPYRRPGRIEIDFSRGLRIRRFRIWIGDQLVYDEVT
ncbi:hypothetical protein Mal15_35780 [Stieleria maiorica]|uniref:Uncharacterized protein n=1 Tax=Stieleria maiorica TaxID=2795974 RepID=A0A5B9MFA0_9BACT|nr:hypothetical protein [Stieleria maiorica]QEF99513.1 hypothetical protein Mal15_35780 [Stieleria maiorica]